MFSSHILSRLLRFGLLGVFIVSFFISIGEVSVNNTDITLSQGGIYTAVAVETGGGAAATPGANDKKAEPESKTLEAFIDIANLFIGVLTFLITPLIMLAGWLLSPDWTFGEIFGLRPILHQIWIFISNIVYVIFGFFLVFIAFANIFGGESAKTYEMKSMLPKLVTGILIVPFTWFIVSAVLSISNILTASVIQLPVDTIQKAGSAGTFLDDKIIPKTIVYNKDHDYDKDKDTGGNIDSHNEDGTVNTADEYKANGNFYASDCVKVPDGCLSIQEFLSNGKGGAYNLLSVYAYGIFKIQDYKFITTEQKLKTLGGIASKLSFSFLFFVVFGILIIAIVYALLSRALILWLYAMFSPIFALNYVMDFKNESVKSSVGRMSIEKFLSLALVPVYVSAALAFGLMFLGLVMNAKGATPTGADGEEGSLKSEVVQANTTPDGVSTFKFGEVTLTTKGVLTKEQKSGLNGALDLGKGVIGTIIMNVLALVILWMAVMAALNADEVTKSAVAPIKSFGDEVGKLALKSPQYIPIPLPGGKSTSMAGLSTIGQSMSQKVSSMAIGDSSEIGAAFGKTIGGTFGLRDTETSQALEKLAAALKKKDPSMAGNAQAKGQDLRDAITSMGITKDKAIGDVNVRSAIVDAMEKTYGLNKGELKDLRSIGNADQFDNKFKELAHKHKGTGIDMLADNNKDVKDSDKFSNLFTGKIENNYTVGDVRMNGDGKIANVDLNFDNEKRDIPVSINQSGEIDRNEIIKAIKGEYKKLDDDKVGSLADEVIQKINEARKTK